MPRRSIRTRRYKRRSRGASTKKSLKRMIKKNRPELKWTDYIHMPASGNTSWLLSSPPAQSVQDEAFGAGGHYYRTYLLGWLNNGAGQNQITGLKYHPKYLNLKMKLCCPIPADLFATYIVARNRFRIIIFYNKNVDSEYELSPPTPVDILRTGALSSTDDSAITSNYRENYRGSFGIIHDKTYSPNINKGNWINLRINKRLRHYAQMSQVNTGGQGTDDYTSRGAIYMMILYGVDTHQGSLDTAVASVDFQSRLYFTDA